MRSIEAEAIGPGEWAEIREEFEAWAQGLLDLAGEMESLEELEAIEIVAEELGLTLDGGDLEEAREIIEQHVAERESGLDDGSGDWRDKTASTGKAGEEATIDAIFTRLAGD